LPEREIDLAFIQHYYLSDDSLRTRFIRETISASYIIPIHYHFTTPVFDSSLIIKNYPDAIIFKEKLETWIMPDKENEFPVLKGDYLGQPLPGKTPVVFGPGIISVDSTVILHPMGKKWK
jgi:hypothetical protein